MNRLKWLTRELFPGVAATFAVYLIGQTFGVMPKLREFLSERADSVDAQRWLLITTLLESGALLTILLMVVLLMIFGRRATAVLTKLGIGRWLDQELAERFDRATNLYVDTCREQMNAADSDEVARTALKAAVDGITASGIEAFHDPERIARSAVLTPDDGHPEVLVVFADRGRFPILSQMTYRASSVTHSDMGIPGAIFSGIVQSPLVLPDAPASEYYKEPASQEGMPTHPIGSLVGSAVHSSNLDTDTPWGVVVYGSTRKHQFTYGHDSFVVESVCRQLNRVFGFYHARDVTVDKSVQTSDTQQVRGE